MGGRDWRLLADVAARSKSCPPGCGGSRNEVLSSWNFCQPGFSVDEMYRRFLGSFIRFGRRRSGVSGLVVLFGLKLSVKPPDADHPYGHGKAEPIAAIVVGACLFWVLLEPSSMRACIRF